MVSDVRPSTRDGWSTVIVSPSPGETLHFHMPTARYSAETIAAILQAAPALYAPQGLTADLFGPEG